MLGKPRPDNAKAYTEAGFEGKITKVQIWNRGLDFTNEIQKQVSLNRFVLTNVFEW